MVGIKQQLTKYPVLLVPEPINLTATYSSSYADGGKVSWTKTTSDSEGNIRVSFPDIRYAYFLVPLHNSAMY